MGNAAYRQGRDSTIEISNFTQHYGGNSDFVAHSRAVTMNPAPWDVTQWIDPFEPYPKINSLPVLL
ncbi:unnamed protein product, partial [Rotaria sp. Silwood1]